MSSLLPTVWPAVEYRGDAVGRIPPHVIVTGNPSAVAEMMPVFKHAYVSAVRNMASGIAAQQVINKRFSNGSRMTIISNHMQDTVYLYAEAEDSGLPSSAFLVTMEDGSQRIYFFDFDESEFDYVEVSDFFAGIRGIKVRNVFLSWDGTGGGDVAHEKPPTSMPVPNYDPKPFGHMTGSLYANGIEFEFVEGVIYGVGVSGSSIMVATILNGRLQIHSGSIEFDSNDRISAISYGEVIGFAQMGEDRATIVNFNSDLTKCVCGRLIVTIPEKSYGPSTMFSTVSIQLQSDESVRYAGFVPVKNKEDTLHFTIMRETLKVVGGYVAPKNSFEYSSEISGWNDSPDSHVTSQKVDVTYEYFDLEYIGTMPQTPNTADRKGKVHKDLVATIIKKPIIIFQGIYPVTSYTWMRTITQEETSAENIFYWYRDYLNDEFVRCNWSRGYIKTAQYDEYGAFEPVETDVLNTFAINVNKQKVIMGGYWFYAVGNGEGDFILRKQPNNFISDAMLVSKTGAMKIVPGTKAIAIF